MKVCEKVLEKETKCKTKLGNLQIPFVCAQVCVESVFTVYTQLFMLS